MKLLDVDSNNVNLEAILTSYISTIVLNETRLIYRKLMKDSEHLISVDNLASFNYNLNSDSELDLSFLTAKEKEILEYSMQGYSDKEIGKKLNLTRQTVNKVKLQARHKCRVSLEI